MSTLLDDPQESVFVKAETAQRLPARRGRPRKRKPADAMFALEIHKNGQGRLVMVGKASRKRATTFVNIPVSADLRKRLDERIIGSMAMGTGALLQWALDELDRQGISVEAQPNE
ncbi:MAG: hypothetical protein WA970_25665 [Gammaproteobacteria bacterium]|nr:hypothetical protein [Gammaproteobacteria bacterium]